MDKSDANALPTASNVAKTIKENITFEKLRQSID